MTRFTRLAWTAATALAWSTLPLMDLVQGRRVKMPARTLARRRLRELRPVARELGCSRQLARIEFILDSGTGAMRQLQVWNANRDIVEVAQEIAAATEAV